MGSHPARGPARATPQLQLCGAARAAWPDGRTTALAPEQAAILALLALKGSVPRAWLTGLLYGDGRSIPAQGKLRQQVNNIKQLLGERVLESDRHTLALGSGVVHDLVDPHAALAQDPGACQAEPLQGLAFASKPGLAEAIADERKRWHARVEDALRRCALEAAATHPARAVTYARRLAAGQPHSDAAVRLLMQMLADHHETAAALMAFDAFKARLWRELRLQPEDETVQLEVRLADAAASRGPARAELPAALRQPLTMVGRAGALAHVRRRLDGGLPVLVTGPAGIGKTRLFEELRVALAPAVAISLRADEALPSLELLRRLARQVHAATGSADGGVPGDAGKALRWLAGAGGSEQPPAGAMNPRRMAALLRDLLREARRRGVALIAIDNVEFADAASLELLGPCWPDPARGDAELPNWLLTGREPLAEALRPWLDHGAPPGALVTLGELRLDDVAALLRATNVPGVDATLWAPALHAHCGGVPMSLLKVLRMLHDRGELGRAAPPPRLPMPDEYDSSVQRLLGRFDETTLRLALHGAVAASDFSPRLAARTLGLETDALLVPWFRLEQAGILHGDAFSHELVRQAVLAAVPAALRPEVHRRLARALTELDAPFDSRARHWQGAGEPLLAADSTERAAADLIRAGLPMQARARLLAAAALYAAGGNTARALDSRVRAAEATRGSVPNAEAIAELRQLLDEPLAAPQRVRVLCGLAERLVDEQEPAALAAAMQAVEVAAGCEDPALLVQARMHEATARRLHGEHAAARDILDGVLARRAVLDPAQQAEARLRHAQALDSCGQRTQAIDLMLRLLDEVIGQGDPYLAADVANSVAVACACANRLDDACRLTEQSLALSRRAGLEPSHLLVDEMNLMSLFIDRACFDQALDMGRRVLDDMRRCGHAWQVQCENIVSSAYVLLGQRTLALDVLTALPANAPAWQRAFRRATRAALEHGRYSLARRQATGEAMALLREQGAGARPEAEARLALELARVSAPGIALQGAIDGKRAALALQHPALFRLASLCEIEAALRARRHAHAAGAADELVHAMAGGWETFAVYLPELWWHMVSAWDATGQAGKADALAAHAAAWIGERLATAVPLAYRHGFRTRNPFNRRLLQRRTQR